MGNFKPSAKKRTIFSGILKKIKKISKKNLHSCKQGLFYETFKSLLSFLYRKKAEYEN